MLGRRERRQAELFVAGPRGDLVPGEPILARVDRGLELSRLPDEVAACSRAATRRPGVDPEVAVRLMLAGLRLGIVDDRRLMREGQVDLAIRWFTGCGLHEALPEHASLTRVRQRWGAAQFARIVQRAVAAGVTAGIAKGEVVHIDSSPIRAAVNRWPPACRLGRCARFCCTGLADMQIQACLVATALTLERLAAAFLVPILAVSHARQRPIGHNRALRRA